MKALFQVMAQPVFPDSVRTVANSTARMLYQDEIKVGDDVVKQLLFVERPLQLSEFVLIKLDCHIESARHLLALVHDGCFSCHWAGLKRKDIFLLTVLDTQKSTTDTLGAGAVFSGSWLINDSVQNPPHKVG